MFGFFNTGLESKSGNNSCHQKNKLSKKDWSHNTYQWQTVYQIKSFIFLLKLKVTINLDKKKQNYQKWACYY